MFIVMHCMGMPFNGSTIESESLGGSETAAYYVAKELVSQGHSVTIFTTHKKGGVWDGVKYIPLGEITNQTPLGFDFHFYATGTPHDIMIIQRHSSAFIHNWASKVNIWWTHDLALYRQKDLVNNQMWNIDAVLTVSEYHKKQVCQVYGLNSDVVHVLNNGIDHELFKYAVFDSLGKDQQRKGKPPYQLLYSSRPERGLEYLVKDDGIMDQLGSDYELQVCAYQNTVPQMEDYYKYLLSQCNKKKNIRNIGALTKQELAYIMLEVDLLVYPTVFEEVSCITAMEAMAAGLPMITNDHAALPETCGNGTLLISHVKGEVDIKDFALRIKKLCIGRVKYDHMARSQLKRANQFTWEKSVQSLSALFSRLFTNSPLSIYNAMIQNSDIVVLTLRWKDRPPLIDALNKFLNKQVNKLYNFALKGNFKQHYEDYYEYEKNRGVEYGPEDLAGNNRFECVSGIVAGLPDLCTVLDYGCAHGHYTINLAKRFPNLRFIGIDIESSNIEKAKVWAEKDGIRNVEFRCGSTDTGLDFTGTGALEKPSLVIMAEVLEHVWEIQPIVDALAAIAQPDALMLVTTPYGPWEAQGYIEHYPWRAHLHHLERADLHDLWGHLPGFNVIVVPAGQGKHGEIMGSYVITFKRGEAIKQGTIDYKRKLAIASNKQTVSLCMIVKDGQNSLGASVESAIGICDEVIIGVDEKTKDATAMIVNALVDKYPMVRFDSFFIPSPLETGFDVARNTVIDKASGDWILTLDTDEILNGVDNLPRYLKNNQYAGFAIPQHHFAVDPLGVMKTDLPLRIFRNYIGIKYFGLVHEHPETELNKGVGYAMVLGDVSIAHNGYMNNQIRKQRFNRNFELMKRDREKNPTRVLGKSLWVRDLAQSIKFEVEAGVHENQSMHDRANEAIKLWRELLNDSSRMAADTLIYYSSCVMLVHPKKCVNYGFSVKAQAVNGQLMDMKDAPVHQGIFFNIDHAKTFFNKVEADYLENIGSVYQ